MIFIVIGFIFIFIHFSRFDNFLSVKIMFDKETQQGDVALSYVIVSLNKNDKRPIKHLNIDFQVKL